MVTAAFASGVIAGFAACAVTGTAVIAAGLWLLLRRARRW